MPAGERGGAERSITRAAGLVMAGFLLSNLTGLAQRILTTRSFGTGFELDAFFAAQRVPDLLFNLLAGGALASAFIPAFTALLGRGDRQGAWRLASSISILTALVLGGLSVLAWLTAPWLVHNVLAPGFPLSQAEITAALMRTLLTTAVVFGWSGLLMGILQAHKHFRLPALAPTLYWGGWIIGVVFFAPQLGIHGLAWGVVLGSVLHLGVQLPGLR